MSKLILTTKEEKSKFFKGMNSLADAVTSTLGFAGKPVLSSRGHGHEPIVTKDGYYTSKEIVFNDWIEDAGSMILKANAKKTAEQTGDNTTTVTLLGQYLINEGNELVEGGANPRKVKQGIDKCVKFIIDYLDTISIKINGNNEKIKQVATIAANNDEVIGKMISDMYIKIGEKGLIELEESGTNETTTDVKMGAQFRRGYLNNDWINNKEKNAIIIKDALVLVVNDDILKLNQLDPFLKSVSEMRGNNNPQRHPLVGVPIVIYANDFGSEVTDSLLASNINLGTEIICLKPTMSYRTECLQDICIVTGATMVSIENALTLKEANISISGGAKEVKIAKDYAVIYGGEGEQEKFANHKKEIQVQIDDTETPPELKEILEKRLALISGSIGIIKAGGVTQVEMKERKDRIEDAVRATKCAIEEGVLAGGGKAMIECAKKMQENIISEPFASFNDDEMKAFLMVREALYAPLRKMCNNGFLDTELIVEAVKKEGGFIGYNFKTEQIENLIDSGVVDATKVVKYAIINASSVAGQIITSGSFLIEVPVHQLSA